MDEESRKQNERFIEDAGNASTTNKRFSNPRIRASYSTKRTANVSNTHYSKTNERKSFVSHIRSPDRKNTEESDESLENFRERQENSNEVFHRKPRKIYPISYSKLSELIEKNPNEILLIILNKYSGFLSRVEESNIGQDLLAYMFIALGKACLSDMHKNIIDLIKIVCGSKRSILIHVQQYLVCLQKQEALEKLHFDSLFYIVVLLQKFQHTLPSSSSDLISMLLPLLLSTKEKCLKTGDDLYVKISEKIKEVDEQNRCFLDGLSLREIKKLSEKEKLHLLEPTESFRSISSLPNKDDIDSPCTFLRPNIVKGKYKDTEHYLDVQFRLLREDYIKPLRDGIAEYLSLKELGKSFKTCKDVRVYSNATIVGEEFLNGHLLHFLHFSDNFFASIKWDRSKRFLTGSLLCLSSDDFQTMLFATVVRRNPDELKRGLLRIEFQVITENVLNLNESVNFVVIETTAYFEAYRHNLNALHQLNDKNLPLKTYIVDVEKTIGKPQYLLPSTTYDMRPLMIPLDKKYISCGNSTEYIYPITIGRVAESVSVINESTWPTASDLNLDNSQYMALKTAVTKEFAIIQGPPGTGKTYIGLRIVQLLLHNLSKWFSNETKSIPILVVCFTNHALDQFLEGLLLFTKEIVRIGGRGKNEAISEYQIHKLKSSYIANSEFPSYLSSNIWEKNDELRTLKAQINDLNFRIENSGKYVLSESELQNCIPPFQYHSLKNCYFDQYYGYYESTIFDWLSVDSYVIKSMKTLSKKQYEFRSNNSFDVICDEVNVVESEDEADLEYIENERDIDFYDFGDAPVPNVEYEVLDDYEDFGWKTQESKNHRHKMMKYIKERLELSETMKEDVALKMHNVWMLDIDKRWQLYKFWIQRYVEELKKKFIDLQQQLKNKFDELAEMQAEEDLHILYNAHVVGMTTTGAAKYRHLVQRLNPAILIVEEAAEILESHIVTSLAPGTQHVILIGDQQQLRPSPSVHLLAVKYDLDVSLFERMIKNGINYCKLSMQHRMRPDIAALISPHIYPNLENHRVVTEFEDIKGVKKNVFFISHNFHELQESDSKSKVNEHEARFLLRLCKYLILQGYDPSQITILTTYSGQLFILKNLTSDEDVRKVRMTVVDNFQGEENDIILLSFVRSNKDGEIGFLKVPNRVCVALSRAKKGLFCIGNFEILAEKSNLWKNIVDTLVEKQSLGPSLELVCQNHPNVGNAVATEADFMSIPDGGCAQNCEYRLQCGHICPLRCHPYDHEFVRCEKPCVKTCTEGHPCSKKCFEVCGFCTVLVDRTLTRCGHTVKASCGEDKAQIACTFNCEKILYCKHRCVKKCGEPCVKKCEESCSKTCKEGHPCKKKCFENCGSCDVQVEKTLSRCGHTVITDCGKSDFEIECTFDCKNVLPCLHNCTNKCGEPCVVKCVQLKKIQSPVCNHTLNVRCFLVNDTEKLLAENDFMKCSEPCQEVLPCDHVCKGTCGSCSQGRLHVACNEPCGRTLICGHKCASICSKSCPPCQKPCENKCIHGRCPQKCSQPCIKCTKPCEWSCTHKKCTRLCGEICDRDPCNEPCPKSLSCGHLCIGFCGEPCPDGCGVCDEKEFDSHIISDELSKSKNKAPARYILLEDCNHKFEVQSVDDKMTAVSEGSKEVQLKICPVCKTVIRKNVRYGNVIKTCLMQIENVKRVTRWDKGRNSELQRTLCNRIRNSTLHKESFYIPLLNFLSLKKIRKIQELITIENILNIISDFDSLKIYQNIFNRFLNTSASKLLTDYANTSIMWLSNFIERNFIFASEYQLIQLSMEIHRLRLISKFFSFVTLHCLKDSSPEFNTCAKYLLNYAPFDDKIINEFIAAFQSLTVKLDGNDKLITLKELPVLKGMNMSAGHWYQCSKGHSYCTIAYTEVTHRECYECSEINNKLLSSYLTGSSTSSYSRSGTYPRGAYSRRGFRRRPRRSPIPLLN